MNLNDPLSEEEWTEYCRRKSPRKPAKMGDLGPHRQKMLLSGLDCDSGQRDLFDVDGAGQDIRISDHVDGARCQVTFAGKTTTFLIYWRGNETREEVRAKAAKKAAEYLAELRAIAAEGEAT